MGISRTETNSNKNDNSTSFSDKEAGFIIAKLRQATYQGTEFETFYQVISKLQTIVEKNSK